MVVSASINSLLDVSVRLDDENVWESGGADYGSGSGRARPVHRRAQPLSGFAGLTESTIGNREGAIGMLGMASPSGYLDLESQSVTGAAQDGTGTVDGVPGDLLPRRGRPVEAGGRARHERRRDHDGQRGRRACCTRRATPAPRRGSHSTRPATSARSPRWPASPTAAPSRWRPPSRSSAAPARSRCRASRPHRRRRRTARARSRRRPRRHAPAVSTTRRPAGVDDRAGRVDERADDVHDPDHDDATTTAPTQPVP